MTSTVAKTTVEYDAMSPFWHLTASLRGGTPAMRAAGRVYLPQEPGESEEAYRNRLDRSVLTNLYRKTVDKMVGKPLKKPVVIEEDVPALVRELLDDVDALGTSLDVFARGVLSAAIDDGITHILVDMPEVTEVEGAFPDGSLTLEQEKDIGLRPFARHVRAADLIGWKWTVSKGRKILTQIRIREFVKVDVDEFTQEVKERIRVIEPGRWQLWEKEEKAGGTGSGKKEEWVLRVEGTNTMEEITLCTLYTEQLGFMMGAPLLMDVAHLNVAHWQSDSDQRNLLHVARVPILFMTGIGDEDDQVDLAIGPTSFVRGPQGADMKYVEHTGAALDAGIKDLESIELRIQTLGMQFLVRRDPGNVTATGRALDQVEADSPLGVISQELENCLETMLDFFAMWLDIGEGGGSVSVFKDFGIELGDAKEIELLVKTRMAGEISRTTFFKELKRRGLLSDDFDAQTEIDLLDIESGGTASGETQESEQIDGEEPDSSIPEGRNKPGDTTSLADGHRHILEEGGKTDVFIDDEGVSHFHTWDEFAIRTSVEDGHSHILLARAGGESDKPEPPPLGAEDGAAQQDEVGGVVPIPAGQTTDDEE